MKKSIHILTIILLVFFMVSCKKNKNTNLTSNFKTQKKVTAKDIL